MYQFDENALQEQAKRLITDSEERERVLQFAMHAAEIIENDGVGSYFDDHDAFNLCYHIAGLVKALELKDGRNKEEIQVSDA